MRIDDDHMYHGAALIQIAEHPNFTAINSLSVNGGISRSAYKINDEIAVYFKYASSPKGPYGEYQFVFNSKHLDELAAIRKKNSRTNVALICVEDREICCVPHGEFKRLLRLREAANHGPKDQYTIIVTAPKGKKMRLYVNAPGKKGVTMGETLIARGAFPGNVFA